jgi:hypothetical protein
VTLPKRGETRVTKKKENNYSDATEINGYHTYAYK